MKKQIQVQSEDISKDRLLVKEVMLAIADKFSLFDNTPTSRVPDTIRSFTEREGFGFGLGARILDKIIIVDFNSGQHNSPIFQDVCERLKADLLLTFPGKITEIHEGQSSYITTSK